MKEEDIRPDYLVRESLRLRAEDAKQLLTRRHEFVNVSCPACESDSYRVMFEKSGYIFVVCTECETYFINPRPTPTMLDEFYNVAEYMKHWKKIFTITENSRKNQIFAPRAKRIVELCKKYNTDTKILLDVGAGFGTFCTEIKKYGIFEEVIAVELSNDMAEACRNKKLHVIEKPIEKIELDKISVITSFELIEHLFWPKDFLLACARALTKESLLVLTTPNIKGFELLTLGKLADGIVGPIHLNYFHPESLSKLLNNCSFEVIEVLTPGKLDAELVRKKILSGDFAVSNKPFLKYLLIEQWEKVGEPFQRFLEDNLLSAHSWIVAKKK